MRVLFVFLKNDSGATSIEYALIAAGIAMASPIGSRNVGTRTAIGPNMAWGDIAGQRLARRNAGGASGPG